MTMILVQAALVLAVPSSGQTVDGDLRPALEDRYEKIQQALAVHNETAIKSIISPGYQDVDPSGQVQNRDEWLEGTRDLDPNIARAAKITVVSAYKEGNTIFVKQKYSMNLRKKIQGALHEVTIDATSSDTWNIGDKGLIITRSETDEIWLKLDGVVVSHGLAHKI